MKPTSQFQVRAHLSQTQIPLTLPSLSFEQSLSASISKQLSHNSISGFFPDIQLFKLSFSQKRLEKLAETPEYPELRPLDEILGAKVEKEEENKKQTEESTQETQMTPKDLRCMKEDILLAFEKIIRDKQEAFKQENKSFTFETATQLAVPFQTQLNDIQSQYNYLLSNQGESKEAQVSHQTFEVKLGLKKKHPFTFSLLLAASPFRPRKLSQQVPDYVFISQATVLPPKPSQFFEKFMKLGELWINLPFRLDPLLETALKRSCHSCAENDFISQLKFYISELSKHNKLPLKEQDLWITRVSDFRFFNKLCLVVGKEEDWRENVKRALHFVNALGHSHILLQYPVSGIQIAQPEELASLLRATLIDIVLSDALVSIQEIRVVACQEHSEPVCQSFNKILLQF